MSFYGDLPIQATADFLSKMPKDANISQIWIYFGKFLEQYYTKHSMDEFKPDPTIVDALMKSYKDQHHSGYSHYVVTQSIMEYLSGVMSDENKKKIKESKQ